VDVIQHDAITIAGSSTHVIHCEKVEHQGLLTLYRTMVELTNISKNDAILGRGNFNTSFDVGEVIRPHYHRLWLLYQFQVTWRNTRISRSIFIWKPIDVALTKSSELKSDVLKCVIGLIDHKNIENDVVLVNMHICFCIYWVRESSQLSHLKQN
jgi:hypothetical protein